MAEVQLIIMGRTRAGKPFRPSDWAERLCSQTATFCNKSKLTYSPYIKPVLAEGVRSVLVTGKFDVTMFFGQKNREVHGIVIHSDKLKHAKAFEDWSAFDKRLDTAFEEQRRLS
jgi:hypothetical protein